MQAARLPAGYKISIETRRLDLDVIHHFLREESYRSRGVPRAVAECAVENALCLASIASVALPPSAGWRASWEF
jgi:hypothetical protein